MINILTRIFGSRNERLLKQYGAVVRQINALEPAIAALSDGELAGEDRGVQGPRRAGRSARRAAARGVRRRARGRQARAADAPFRRAADRRHGAPQRQDRGNAHGRGQDARRHAADLPQRARRQRRPSRHGQRLPRAARRGLDGAHLPLSRADGRRQPVADGPRGQAGGVRVRHHLRHQQRIRLRLPARQHGVRGVAARAARPPLRDRRRGGLHPDRRGAHAAHHLGAGRRQRRPVPPAERHRAEARAAEGGEGRGRLLGRREGAPGAPVRAGPRARRAGAGGRRAARRPDRASTTRTTSGSCITCTRRCARTRSSIATSTTSCRTAKS